VIQASILEVHTIKPLDENQILSAAQSTGAIVTAEEHSVLGGLGGAIAECLCGHSDAAFESIGIQDTFAVTAPSVEILMDAYGLSVDGIVAAAKRVISQKSSNRERQ
jgi:transketolase